MNRSIGCPCGQCESCEFPSHREKLVSIPYVSVQCGFLMKGQIGGFHVTSSPPCWWTVNKRSLISSLCLSTSNCSFHHCICVSRDCMKTTYTLQSPNCTLKLAARFKLADSVIDFVGRAQRDMSRKNNERWGRDESLPSPSPSSSTVFSRSLT